MKAFLDGIVFILSFALALFWTFIAPFLPLILLGSEHPLLTPISLVWFVFWGGASFAVMTAGHVRGEFRGPP